MENIDIDKKESISLIKHINDINKQLAKQNQLTYATLYHPIRGKQIDFKTFPYLIDIYEDTAQEIAIQKSGQCGVSEYLIDESFFLTENKKIVGLYCFPAQAQLNEFSHGRVEPVINDSEHFSDIIGDINNVSLKKIGSTHIYFRGMQKIKQIISVDADYIMLDELDQMNKEHIDVVEKRLGASLYKIKRYVSTPTYSNVGINKKYKEGDMREWMIRCDECRTWQALDFFKNVDFDKQIYVCKKCKKPIDNLKTGRWVPRYPDREIHSYHISKLFSPRTTLKELIKAYNNTEARQKFFNFDLGLPYVVEGGKLTNKHLDAVRKDYEIQFTGTRCCMGVDVGNVLHIYVTEFDGEQQKTIFAGTVDGLGEDDFKELDRYMRIYDVVCCVIDALPETRLAKAFAERHPSRVYLAYYPNMPKDVYYMKDKRDGTDVVNINRSLSFDYMFDDFYMKKISLPKNIVNVLDFYKQMTSMTRIICDDRNKNKVVKYIEQDVDHYSHSRNYCRVAEQMVGKELGGFFIPLCKKDRHFQGGSNRIF